MKLTQNQIQQIETYLDSKELTHLDLRNEVLDHMANAIEESIQEEGLTFKEAFNQEINKWNPELVNYSSFWIGWAWTGPKLMIIKAVKETKKFYLKSLLATAVISLMIHMTYISLIGNDHLNIMDGFVGLVYIAILGLTLLFFWRIKATDYQTTYSYLYKINTIGFAFMYLAFNPLLPESNMIFDIEKTYYWGLFFHSFLLSFAYTFWDLYKSHQSSKKLTFA
ncbi:hypothetical protein [Maribacter sp. HTCC2170]|uniref:hypothetical protein n=1 Tax=Maribacter sp. (strain HTCC2170 / KCCM 42371) TaxID=313603 RepID=UPI00006BD478|nr:hypothetical protein [Maribacter sp. HTCC2170]EAR02752.1 hypothetical protein FB2170_05675 [Maribacter sp. HTCC2170]